MCAEPNNPKCTMCNKLGQPAHIYPGPIREVWYAPREQWQKAIRNNGPQAMVDVWLHSVCIGPFLQLNKDRDLVITLAHDR